MSNDSASTPEKPKAFEWFELSAALLLGFGAVGASLSGYQAGLWNGKTTESFAKSTSLITLAAADDHRAMLVNLHDAEIDLEAKKLIAEATVQTESKLRQDTLKMASSLYIHHLSDSAYRDLGLPAAAKGPAAPEAAMAEDVLVKAAEHDLSESYMQHIFEATEQDRAKGEHEFAAGSHASSEGDRFALAEVLFAVSLFISGTSLVFKTRLRWVFAGMGCLALLAAVGYITGLEWM